MQELLAFQEFQNFNFFKENQELKKISNHFQSFLIIPRFMRISIFYRIPCFSKNKNIWNSNNLELKKCISLNISTISFQKWKKNQRSPRIPTILIIPRFSMISIFQELQIFKEIRDP